MSSFPSLPPPGNNQFSAKLKELVEIWRGLRGNKLDRVVTYRDLVNSTLGTLSKNGSLQPGAGVSIPTTRVTILSNLTAVAAFQNIILSWSGINQANYAYTEIWRASTDNLSNATLVGGTVADVFTDRVGSNAGYYYWVRAVSTSNLPGPFNATSGVYALSLIHI